MYYTYLISICEEFKKDTCYGCFAFLTCNTGATSIQYLTLKSKHEFFEVDNPIPKLNKFINDVKDGVYQIKLLSHPFNHPFITYDEFKNKDLKDVDNISFIGRNSNILMTIYKFENRIHKGD